MDRMNGRKKAACIPYFMPRGEGAHHLEYHAHPAGPTDMVSKDRTQAQKTLA